MNKIRLTLLPLFFSLCLTKTIDATADNILIIESYHAEFQWDTEYKKGIVDNVLGKHDFSYFQLDTKRLPEKEHANRVELAWQKYLAESPNIVVLGDDNALKYLGPRLKNTATPVVYLGINNNPRNYKLYQEKNITGVLERPLLKRSILYLNKLFDEVNKVLVLFDASTTSSAAVDMEFKKSNVLKLGEISVEIDQIAQYSLWQKKVQSASINNVDFIIVGIYEAMRDEQGNHVSAKQVIEWTSMHSEVPVFGFWDFSIGEGKAIGGLVIEGYQQGYAAAQIINRIVAGEVVEKIRPQVAKKGRYIFSKAELIKHQLTIPQEIKRTITWVK